MTRHHTIHRLVVLAILASLLPLEHRAAQAQSFGNCVPSVSDAYLDANNVRARILNNGSLFYNPELSAYRIPRYSRSNTMWSASLLVAGRVNGEIRAAAANYQRWEYWAGPLDDSAQPPGDCSEYDRIYKVSRPDIVTYEATGFATQDLREWPTGLGAPTLGVRGGMLDLLGIPLTERKDRLINLEAGERPVLIGDQAVWWIMNDAGNEHKSTHSLPLGIEVHVHAFAISTSFDAIHNATFYRYRIFNRSVVQIEDAYIGFLMDPDLGYSADDYIGVDTLRNLAYVYNADNEDDENEYSYGTNPPAFGFLILEGPLADKDGRDNNTDSFIDESGERAPLSHFMWPFTHCDISGCEPRGGEDYYDYLQSRFRNGEKLTIGGNGESFSNRPTNYLFPGDPVRGEFWSEVNVDSMGTSYAGSDRRFVVSTGPITLEPGGETDFTFAMVWARGEDYLDSITELRTAADHISVIHRMGYPGLPEGSPPEQVVSLVSPANSVSYQPRNPTLYWNSTGDSEGYRVELSGAGVATDTTVFTPDVTFDGLSPNTQYYWRVRGENSFGTAPWSKTWTFTTGTVVDGFGIAHFSVVANASGALNPPDMAAYATNNSGFPTMPCPLVPDVMCNSPTPGYQQSLSDAVWGIHTGGNRVTYNDGSRSSFIYRSFRGRTIEEALGINDFEMRFSQRCVDDPSSCIAWRPFGDDLPLSVPFEIWNVGPTDDAADDYRMIPGLCENNCSAGQNLWVFDIGGDHRISENDDDPYTDWTYWFNPMDTSPGEAGYLVFAEAPGNDSDALGEEVIARMVLVQENGGEAPPYNVELPETGTVFRITTIKPAEPALSAPRDETIFKPPIVTFYWSGTGANRLQIINLDTDLEVFNQNSLKPGYIVELSQNGLYSWRVQNILGIWSEAWTFRIDATHTGTETLTDNEIPVDFKLYYNYPNPFNPTTTIRYTLPRAAEVRLEVFNVIGERVRVLENRTKPAGEYEVSFDATGLGSGIYFYTLRAGDFVTTKTMVVLR